ncbi:MAG: glycosyltransferase, partial [Acidobacteriota bacterium]
MTPRLSIFLPVYNEEENLRRLYDALIESLAAIGESFELIFVDDGSTDR